MVINRPARIICYGCLVEDLKSYEEFVRHKLHNIPGIASD